MAGTDLLPQTPQEQDNAYNPADADYLLSPEHMAKNPEQYPDREKLNDAEKTPEAPAGDDINYSPTGTNSNKSQPLWSRISKNKRVAIGSIGALGGGGLVLALFMGLLPLKLEALISNITDAASEVPGYAVEQRTEYLITRVLATRMLMLANGTDEKTGETVFCKNSSISCSLFSTYTADYFSKEMDFDMTKESRGNVKLSVKESGRERLGGKATSWTISIETGLNTDTDGINKVVEKLDFSTNREMKNYLKATVNTKLHHKNVISRFVARKILMKKYGVTSWRAFEKTTNKVNDIKTSMKAAMYKNTIGRISPRFGAYLACFQGGTDPCDKLIESLSADLGTVEKPTDENAPDYQEKLAEYEKKQKQIEALSKLTAKLSGDIPAVPDAGIEKIIGKLFSSKIIAAATGAGAVIGGIQLVDLGLSGVGAVESGAASLVKLDMNSQIYTGFAYGDAVGVVTNWEKAKAGDFTDNGGGEVINELSTLVDCDGSPLCAYESGYIDTNSTVSAASNQVKRECPTENGYEMTTLPAGELVCPTYQLLPDYTKEFADNPLWKTAVAMNTAWVAAGAHAIVQIYTEVSGALIDAAETALGLDKLFAGIAGWAKDQLQPLMNWIMATVFNPAAAGYGVPTSLNYDALSGAIHTEQWELMQNGIDTDGTVLGGGGQYLNSEEASAITAYQNTADQENFNNQSLFAKLFDPSLKGSLVQLATVQMPTTLSGLAKLPAKTMAALFSLPGAKAASTTQWQDFHLPQYGYKLNDPVIRADPSIYTEAYCTASAQARADPANKKKVGNSIIAVYTVSDPCALEKLVVGSAVTTANPTDKYAFKPLFNASSTASSGSCPTGTELVKDITEGWDRGGDKKTIVLCSIPGTTMTGEGLWKDERYKGTTALGITTLTINSKGAAALLEAAELAKSEEGGKVTLGASIGYRSLFEQCSIYIRDYARPSECPDWITKIDAGWSTTTLYSNHMMGLSLDFDAASESWMRTCMQSNDKEKYDKKDDNRCYGFWDDVKQKQGWDDAHFTYDP